MKKNGVHNTFPNLDARNDLAYSNEIVIIQKKKSMKFTNYNVLTTLIQLSKD